mmetsp:Transcript_24996/g.99333  ORF Transcript_24996/g.99333 Transcript_24996/m.99333 type:complete len:271 (-) Transcript_24996:88-900(-)
MSSWQRAEGAVQQTGVLGRGERRDEVAGPVDDHKRRAPRGPQNSRSLGHPRRRRHVLLDRRGDEAGRVADGPAVAARVETQLGDEARRGARGVAQFGAEPGVEIVAAQRAIACAPLPRQRGERLRGGTARNERRDAISTRRPGPIQGRRRVARGEAQRDAVHGDGTERGVVIVECVGLHDDGRVGTAVGATRRDRRGRIIERGRQHEHGAPATWLDRRRTPTSGVFEAAYAAGAAQAQRRHGRAHAARPPHDLGRPRVEVDDRGAVGGVD